MCAWYWVYEINARMICIRAYVLKSVNGYEYGIVTKTSSNAMIWVLCILHVNE